MHRIIKVPAATLFRPRAIYIAYWKTLLVSLSISARYVFVDLDTHNIFKLDLNGRILLIFICKSVFEDFKYFLSKGKEYTLIEFRIFTILLGTRTS